jgi:hypothetical protein
MYFLEFGDWYKPNAEEKQSIHEFYYEYGNWIETLDNYRDWYKFTVVREPIDRFISFYQNKILQEKQYFETPVEIDRLALNLEKYRSQNTNLKHHTETQKTFTGDDLGVFDGVYKIEDLSELHHRIKEKTGLQFTLPRKNISNSQDKEKFSLSDEAIIKLIDFYKEDYVLLKSFYEVP